MTASDDRRAHPLRWLVDRTLSGVLDLPPAENRYDVREVRVPMRDGVELVTDHYVPRSRARGTLLVRGPYGRLVHYAMQVARAFAERGYHVLFQSVRGTYGSGGIFEPMVHEADDALDTVAWMREQPWFDGQFGTVGMSYLGFTQWALLQDPPPELAASVICVGPHNFARVSHGTGAFTLNDFLGWSDMVGITLTDQRTSTLVRHMAGSKRRLAPAMGNGPLAAGGRAVLGDLAPWWEAWVEHSDITDPFWAEADVSSALDAVTTPVLIVSGWQDLFLDQSLEQYQHLRRRGVETALTVGPWTHTQIGSGAGTGPWIRDSLQWLGQHLDGSQPPRPARVLFYNTGAGPDGKGRWLTADDWPPAGSDRVLHLASGGRLADTAGAGERHTVAFVFDPADPTPTLGGRLLSPEAGVKNVTRWEERPDIVTFTSEPLASPLTVIGEPRVRLDHASDHPYADVFVRLADVDDKGRSHNVSDGFRRLDPARQVAPIDLTMDAIAHTFGAGHRIRLAVAGGNHPRFARNLGTDEPGHSGSRMQAVRHTVQLGGSSVTLPVG